jgi:hypothetical protein
MSDSDEVRKVFESFASWGFQASNPQTEMDSTRLQKLAKQCRLIDRKLTTSDVDLYFLKVSLGILKGLKISLKNFGRSLHWLCHIGEAGKEACHL